MELKPVQQFEKILKDSKNILMLLPQSPNGDAIGSGWALYYFLKNKGIDVSIALSDPFNNVNKFNFLPKPNGIQNNILGAKDFILSFSTKYNKIINIKTEEKGNEVRIHITPEHGSIDPRDFSFIPAKFKYDLIITIGAPDRESIGKIYEDNPDIFYEVPIINIDHHNSNDNFGQINIVDITASSTSEILADALEQIDSNSINEIVSNCLLTGIISSTESFQNNKTTPKALQISAKLMSSGANQQKIVRYLYKTQPLNLLKLWGRIMAQLKWDERISLAWSTISIEDFVQSRSKPEDIPFILDKIKDNYSSGKIFLILFNEEGDTFKGIMKFAKMEDLKKAHLLAEGKIKGEIYEFKINGQNIKEAEDKVMNKIKGWISEVKEIRE